MSSQLETKQKSKKGEATKEIIDHVPFSYTIVCPLLRHQNHTCFEWNIIDKGSKKLKRFQKYEISVNRIHSAMYKIRKHIWETPCFKSSLLNHQGFHIYLKAEFCQVTNSIKARGVIYTLLQLTHEEKCKGVIAISTGSFAYSLCYYGKIFEIPVTIVMPISTADEQVKNCRKYKATVLVQGRDMLEAHNIALRIAKTNGLYYLDGNDHPNMIIGQATLGIEILDDIKNIDAVLLPTAINGCGLTTGIAMAIKEYNPKIKVIEVQTEVTDSLIENVRTQTTSPNELEIPTTDYTWYRNSIGLPEMWLDTIITVNKTLVNIAADILLNEENIDDSSAAISLAAILTGEIHPGLKR
ncbi:L-threonine dehydratase catabolic TdcB-like [Mycetomoellerius zeteki]|uniref:L-threonine dehydratase catabolic TdcB-like n=1 Tax=Mycetomoellerius zeteki TaxID=64791 RepID=UPI00084E6C12|nr:PREDICTED: L-threonine dehydratase catabolic TdcB-like [Trachymyrmex zeteki]